MKISLRELLLIVVLCALGFALALLVTKYQTAVTDLKHYQTEAFELRKRFATLRNPSAVIRVTQLNSSNSWSRPLYIEPGHYSFHHTSKAKSSQNDQSIHLNVSYVASTPDGDVYQIFWSESKRLTPRPSMLDFPDSSAIITTGATRQTIAKLDHWLIEVYDDPSER